MADPLSATAASVQFAGLALNAVIKLYELVQQYKNSSKLIENVTEELRALVTLLQSLQSLPQDSDVDLTALEVPLQRCSTVCEEFQVLISSISPEDAKSGKFRGWLKLQSNGQSIKSFQTSLEIWRSTICIALGDINL
jgi:hypothetical protein